MENISTMTNQLFLLFVGVCVAAAAGYLGTFMVLKRMSLVGDALSHVALPGMAIALMFNISPMLGAFAALFLAIIFIWHLGEKSAVYPDALVGVIFTASLALGILITPQAELLEALFGKIENITVLEGSIAILLSVVVIIVTMMIAKKLMLLIVSPDLALSSGVKTSLVNLIYLLAVGTVVALGVKFVGTLLTGALVVVPASAAKNMSSRMIVYALLATFFGIASAAMGVWLSNLLGVPTGPLVVLVSVTFFVISFLFRIVAGR